MTWRWRIFFSLAAAQVFLAGATVTGSVELTDQRDASMRKHKDYSGVVVWLEPLDSKARAAEPPPRKAEIVQKDKKFIPHILAVPVGTQVDFPNFDPIFHNAFSKFSGQPFDVGLYPPGTSKSITFTRPGVVRVFCNIHQTMSAVIVVVKTPWFAVSNSRGAFEIAGVPPGEYRLHVFHERSSSEALKALDRLVSVQGGAPSLPTIQISEAGYAPAPHK